MFSGRKPSENDLLGCWKVVSCYLSDEEYPSVSGVQFRLEEGGDLVWKVLPTAEQETLPFFSCETFEFDSSGGELKCYGSNVDTIELKCSLQSNQLVLSLEKVLKLHCEQVIEVDSDNLASQPYSLLPALSEGFFADITFTANNGEKIPAHKTILTCSFAGQTWDTIPPFLRGLAPDVLHGLLHYLYTASLPGDISEDTAKQLQRISQVDQGIGNLGELCSEFLEATAVKNRIRSLTGDLYSTLEHVVQMAESLTGLSHNSSHTSDSIQRHGLDPAKLTDVTKRALRQLATGILKFVLLCEIFTKQKSDLSREERQEIIQHCRTRLPCFAELVERLLIICHSTLSGLSVSQKEDIALYLIPEVEAMWSTSTELGSDTHSALERIVQKADTDHKKKNHLPKMGTSLSRTLRNAVHLREVLTLKRFQDKASSSLVFVLQKREDFSVMSEDQKLRAVVKAMNKMMTEIPDHIRTLHRFPKILEKKLSWKEWKHLFKVWTSRVSLVLRKVLANREVLQPVIHRTCELVNQEEFNRVAKELGLVSTPSTEEERSHNPTPYKKSTARVESVVTPPSGAQSPLANSVTQLLSSGCHADMCFVLDSASPAHSPGCPECQMKTNQGSVEIPAHRVVIAARCDWFRRALLSGMKESIERRILVPDTSPCLFRKFLVYVYSGVLDTSSLSVEQLADLLSLSDRYEMDSLKEICQGKLQRHLSEDSVLFLLGVADQYGASRLKEESLRYVTSHADVIESEVFEELPCHVKQEVREIIQQTMPRINPVDEVEEVRQAFAMTSFSNYDDDIDMSDDSDDDDADDVMSRGNSQVERCIELLKDVLGDSVPRRELVRVTLAADCDVNRALNFYFA